MSGQVLLSVQAISKSFGGSREVLALDRISFDVEVGEFLMLVGPSGCGKSTLLSILAGLTPADSGTVQIGGKTITGPGPDRGLVFQDGALFPWLTVRQNVEFGLKQSGVAPRIRRERAERYLQQVGLLDFADSAVHELSGGMRQRVAICRCLVLEPELLLMDEPFSALDAITREDLYSVLQDLRLERTTTVVFVTHNVREAVTLGDRVLLLQPSPGRIRHEYPIHILRPRQIDDVDVTLRAQQISRAMREPTESRHEPSQEIDLLPPAARALGSDFGP